MDKIYTRFYDQTGAKPLLDGAAYTYTGISYLREYAPGLYKTTNISRECPGDF